MSELSAVWLWQKVRRQLALFLRTRVADQEGRLFDCPLASRTAPAGSMEDGSMLVLTRKVGERIVVRVGEMRIEFEIVAAAANRVKVGVTAPRETVSVVRGEIETRERSAA